MKRLSRVVIGRSMGFEQLASSLGEGDEIGPRFPINRGDVANQSL
jgi:hypothetical protein